MSEHAARLGKSVLDARQEYYQAQVHIEQSRQNNRDFLLGQAQLSELEYQKYRDNRRNCDRYLLQATEQHRTERSARALYNHLAAGEEESEQHNRYKRTYRAQRYYTEVIFRLVVSSHRRYTYTESHYERHSDRSRSHAAAVKSYRQKLGIDHLQNYSQYKDERIRAEQEIVELKSEYSAKHGYYKKESHAHRDGEYKQKLAAEYRLQLSREHPQIGLGDGDSYAEYQADNHNDDELTRRAALALLELLLIDELRTYILAYRDHGYVHAQRKERDTRHDHYESYYEIDYYGLIDAE